MPQIALAKLDNDIIMDVEASDFSRAINPNDRLQTVALADAIADRAAKSVQEALSRMQPALVKIVDQLRNTATPDSVEVSFGLKCSVGAFWFISAGSEANFTVTVSWKNT